MSAGGSGIGSEVALADALEDCKRIGRWRSRLDPSTHLLSLVPNQRSSVRPGQM